MLEKRFLNLVGIDGIFSIILGIIMLMVPKITSFAVAFILAIILTAYGLYRIVNSVIERKYIRHVFLNIFIGLILLTCGIILFLYPVFNLVLLTSTIAVYFILESIATAAFAFQTRGIVHVWWLNLLTAFLQFFLGLIIILGLPTTALWTIGILLGINFLFSGMSMLMVAMSTKLGRI